MRPSHPIRSFVGLHCHGVRVSLACAFVRALQSLAMDTPEVADPTGDPRGSSHAVDGRVCRRLFVAQTLPFEDGTPRRFLRRRSLVTAGRSRRRSHLRLHILGVHCCTPVCQGESIRRPIPVLPGSSSSDLDDSTPSSISVSGIIIIRPAQSLYRTHWPIYCHPQK